MFPRAALIPPWAATVWDLVGNNLVMVMMVLVMALVMVVEVLMVMVI